MKKIYVGILLCLGVYGTIVAQNRSITFENETKTWEAILEKAQNTGQYVFLNMTAVWCGPCRVLARDIFTRDEVADFFNQNFINANFDIDRGQGSMLRDRYGVSAVPTLMWIDPRTGDIIHRIAGVRNAEFLIEQAEIALGAGEDASLRVLRIRFENSDKTLEDLQPFLAALGRAGMRQEQTRLVSEFLYGFTNEQLMEEEHWALLERHVNDPFSDLIQQVFANQTQFGRELGADRVNRKLASSLQSATNRFMNRDTVPSADFDKEGYNRLLQFLKTANIVEASSAIFQLYVIGYAQREDFASMINSFEDMLKYNLLQGRARDGFTMRQLSRLVRVTDRPTQERAIALVNKIIASTTSEQTRAAYYDVKATLLERYGDATGAAKARESGITRMRENARQEGRSLPMMMF